MNEMDQRAIDRIKELEEDLEEAYQVIGMQDDIIAERDERIVNLLEEIASKDVELSLAHSDRTYQVSDVG